MMEQNDFDTSRMQQLAVAWSMVQPQVTAYLYSIVRDHHDAEDLLQSHQVSRMSRDPLLIRDYARFISRECQKQGLNEVEVRAFVLCSLNGRKPQLLIDPDYDLLTDHTRFGIPEFIVPLAEPLPDKSWTVPIDQWELLVMPDPHRSFYSLN